MKVQLYYFDDCPSYTQAFDNLTEALRLERLPEDIEMIPVADPADAEARRFARSPTIRIDGVNREGPDAESRGYA